MRELRPPLPRTIGYTVSAASDATSVNFDERAAGPPTFIDSREGIVRSVEISAYLDIDVAERLVSWLNDRIEDHKNLANSKTGSKI